MTPYRRAGWWGRGLLLPPGFGFRSGPQGFAKQVEKKNTFEHDVGVSENIWLVGGLEPWNFNEFYDFPIIIGDSNPNWRTHIFQRGRYTTNQMNMYESYPPSHGMYHVIHQKISEKCDKVTGFWGCSPRCWYTNWWFVCCGNCALECPVGLLDDCHGSLV